jgi:hypothetical protein
MIPNNNTIRPDLQSSIYLSHPHCERDFLDLGFWTLDFGFQMPDWHVPAAQGGPQAEQCRDSSAQSHQNPTFRVFVSPCGIMPYDFRKTQSRDVPGTFGKILFLASDGHGLPASGGIHREKIQNVKEHQMLGC